MGTYNLHLMATQFQIQYKAVCIPLCTNAYGKGMNPYILSLAQEKIDG